MAALSGKDVLYVENSMNYITYNIAGEILNIH